MNRFWCALVATLLAAPSAFGQSAPYADPPAVADQSPALFVVNARQATLQGDKLVLDGVSPGAVVFATRPSRSILHVATPDLIELWRTGSFAKNPPNAVVSVFAKDGSGISDVVVVLARPALSGDKLVFDVALVDGSIAGAEGPASVYIDTVWIQGGRYIGHQQDDGRYLASRRQQVRHQHAARLVQPRALGRADPPANPNAAARRCRPAAEAGADEPHPDRVLVSCWLPRSPPAPLSMPRRAPPRRRRAAWPPPMRRRAWRCCSPFTPRAPRCRATRSS